MKIFEWYLWRIFASLFKREHHKMVIDTHGQTRVFDHFVGLAPKGLNKAFSLYIAPIKQFCKIYPIIFGIAIFLNILRSCC